MAYEHSDWRYGECPENPKVLHSTKVLRIPSVVNNTDSQLTVENTEPLTYDGFSMYACQMSHTSMGGL